MDRSEIMRSARLAGQLLRYHSWPVHRAQSVAEHSWQMLRLWCELWGPPPPHITVAITYHDVGEFHAGDVPFPAKAKNPDFKAAYELVEANALKVLMPLGMSFPELSEAETIQLKLVDLLEMHEFGTVEVLMGNQYGEPVATDTWDVVLSLTRSLMAIDLMAALYVVGRYFHEGL